MALIKSIAFSFSVLIGIALLTSAFASEDEVLLEELRESLARNINSEMADLFRTDLKDTGLSSADVERIVAVLENAVVACFLDSLVEHAQTHETPLANLVLEVKGDMGISPVGGDFEELLILCLNAARMEAGIAAMPMD